MYYCEICGVNIPDADNDIHNSGKQHKKMLKLHESCERRVEVTGSTSGQKVIRKYFKQFGPIEDITIHPEKKMMAVTFVDASSHEAALMRLIHLVNKEEITVTAATPALKITKEEALMQCTPKARPKNQYYCEACDSKLQSEQVYLTHLASKKHREIVAEEMRLARGIAVSNFYRSNKDVVRAYCERFGRVESSIMYQHSSSVHVIFADQSGRDAALAVTNHYLEGSPITLEPLVKSHRVDGRVKYQIQKKKSEIAGLFEDVMDVKMIKDQILDLADLYSLRKETVQDKFTFLRNLEAELCRFIPEVKLTAIGPLASGLGTKSDKLEMTLDLDPTVNRHRVDVLPYPLPDLSNLPSLKVDRGMVTLESLIEETTSNILTFFSSCIRASSFTKSVYDFRIISSDPLPKMIFFKKDVGDCEIRFGISMSHVQTGLLRLLSRLDKRFPDLVTIIRFWAHQVAVTTDVWRESIHTHGLIMLVYFYCENTTPPILPTVQGLMDIVDKQYESPVIVQGWDCTFSENIANIKRTLMRSINNQSLPGLVKGFFDFYANLDLFNNVLCPRTGEQIDVMAFRVKNKQNAQMQKFLLKDLLLQCPFKLSHNELGHIHQRAARRTITEEIIKAAVKINRSSMWDLTTFIPLHLRTPGLPPLHKRLMFHLHLTHMPMAFRAYGTVANIEAQWHQWIVELTMKTLAILRIEFEIIYEYDENAELFPKSPSSLPDGEVNTEETEVNTEETEDAELQRGAADTEDIGAADTEDVVDLTNDEVVDLTSDQSDPEEGTSSSGPKGTKRKLQGDDRKQQSKKGKVELDPEEYSHPNVRFSVKKDIKEETIMKCRTFCKAFSNRNIVIDVPEKDYGDSFSHQEAVTKRLFEVGPEIGQLSETPIIECVLRIQRYSYGHSTNIELFPEGHKTELPDVFVNGLRNTLQKLVGSSLSSI